MLPNEIALLESVLRCTENYVEFGCGGSTIVAGKLVGKSIISVESSREWLKKVESAGVTFALNVQPKLWLADIGPTWDLGYPVDEKCRNRWPDYHSTVWGGSAASAGTTFLIDGRFRVACFLQTMLHASANAIVMVHDYANREAYHAITAYAKEIARADNLSVFQRKAGFDKEGAKHLLDAFSYDPR